MRCDRCGAYPVPLISYRDRSRNVSLCQDCFVAARADSARARQIPEPGKQGDLTDRVGIDTFLCECGQAVETWNSVRITRKPHPVAVRVCGDCAQGNSCGVKDHIVVTPLMPAWEEGRFRYTPFPESLHVGLCGVCLMEMYWNVTTKTWQRMSWAVLGAAWEAESVRDSG